MTKPINICWAKEKSHVKNCTFRFMPHIYILPFVKHHQTIHKIISDKMSHVSEIMFGSLNDAPAVSHSILAAMKISLILHCGNYHQ